MSSYLLLFGMFIQKNTIEKYKITFTRLSMLFKTTWRLSVFIPRAFKLLYFMRDNIYGRGWTLGWESGKEKGR